MAETILLIDGMYLVFSSFYSHQNMRTLEGEPTGAAYGFITRVENLIRDLKPHRVGVAFDVREKTFRHKLFPPYKAKRQSPPEELIAQLPHIKEYLQLRGIPTFEVPGFEADDIIAGISKKEAADGNEVLIFTSDKDLFQLVTAAVEKGSIKIFHPRLKEKLDADGVNEHFGIPPERIVDYLSLTGDASDNIPGVPGVGEKTAKKLIGQFGTLDNMLGNMEKVAEKLRNKIETNMDSLDLSRRLIDLHNAPPMETEIEFLPFKNEINDGLISLYEKLSFSSLLKRLTGADTGAKEKAKTELDIKYEIVKTPEQLNQLKEKIYKENYFAYDLETTALEFF
ncbi:MAG: hypothetical protein GY950_05915, partial [bacterium]|nr:hypothetical protein [bacterium]